MKCISPKYITIRINEWKYLLKNCFPIENYWNGKEIEVGCGKCHYCKKRYATIWAKRCEMETIAQQELGQNNNWFLTLTFANEPIINPTLKSWIYDEMTNFIKKIRNKTRKQINGKRTQIRIKYVWVSELGSKKKRVHCHILIWNLPLKIIPWKHSKTGNLMYISNELNTLWGHGIVAVEELTKENAAYLYKYEAKNYLQKCQSGGIGLTFFWKHLDDVLNEKQYQNRYFLKKYRQLLGDTQYLGWMLYELAEAERYRKKETFTEREQKILKLKEKLFSINNKMLKTRDF